MGEPRAHPLRGLQRVPAGVEGMGSAGWGAGWTEEEDEMEALLAEQEASQVSREGASAMVERVGINKAEGRPLPPPPPPPPRRVTPPMAGFGNGLAVVGEVVERDVAAPAPPPGPPRGGGVGGRGGVGAFPAREAWPKAMRRDKGGPDLGRRRERGPAGRAGVREGGDSVEREGWGGGESDADAVLQGMSAAEIADSVAELKDRLGEGRVEMLRRRGASRLGGAKPAPSRKKGLAGGFFGARPEKRKSAPREKESPVAVEAAPPTRSGPSGPSGEVWEMMSGWRWDLAGERVPDPERERAEGEDPECSCVELGAMARSSVSAQRAMAVQILANMVRRSFGRLQCADGPDYAFLGWWTRLWALGLSKRGGGGGKAKSGEGDGGSWPAPLPLLARLCLDDDNVNSSSGGAYLLRECLSQVGGSGRAAALARAAGAAFRGEERCPGSPMEKLNAATVARASKAGGGDIPDPQDAVMESLEVQHVPVHSVGNAASSMDLFWHEVWVRADSMFVEGGGGGEGQAQVLASTKAGEGVSLPKELSPKQAAQLCEYDPVQALVGTHLCARLGFLLSERSLLTFQAQTALLDVLGCMAAHSAGVAAHVSKHTDLLHVICHRLEKPLSGNLCASAFRVFAGIARWSRLGAQRVLSAGAGRAIRDTLRWTQREEIAAMPSTYGLLVDILEFWRVLCRYGGFGADEVPKLDDEEEGRGQRLWEIFPQFLDARRPEGDRDPLYHNGDLPAALPSIVGPHAVASAVFSLLTACCLGGGGGVVGEQVLVESAELARTWVSARHVATSVRASAAHFLASLPRARDHAALGTFLLAECCSEKFEARFCKRQRRTVASRSVGAGPFSSLGSPRHAEYLGFVQGALSGGPGSLTRMDVLTNLCVEEAPGADADAVSEADMLLAGLRLLATAPLEDVAREVIGTGLSVTDALSLCRQAVLARASLKRRRDPLSVMSTLTGSGDIVEASLGAAPDFFLPALPSLMWVMDTADARLCVHLVKMVDACRVDAGGKLEAFSSKFQTLVLCATSITHVGPGHEDIFLDLLHVAMRRFAELTHSPDECVDALEGAVSGVCLNENCLTSAMDRGSEKSDSLLALVGGSFLPAPAHWPLLPLLEPLVDPAKASVKAMLGSLDLVALLDAGVCRRDVQAWCGPDITGAEDKLAHMLPDGVRLLACMGACLCAEDDEELAARLVEVLWTPLESTLREIGSSDASIRASGLGLALITACGGRAELGKTAAALTAALSLGLSMGDARRALHAKLILVLLRADGAPPDIQQGILSGLSGLEHLLDVDDDKTKHNSPSSCTTAIGDVGVAFSRRHDVDVDIPDDARMLLRHCVDALDRLDRGGAGPGAGRRGRVHAAIVEESVLSFVQGTLCSRARSALPGRSAMLREALMTLPKPTVERLLRRIPSKLYLDHHIAQHLVDFAREKCPAWDASEADLLRWCTAN